MAYDPTKPVDDSLATASELRNQLNGLKSEIDDKPETSDVQQMINDSITTQTAGECSELDDFQMTVSDPPTRAEMQTIADTLHNLIFYLKREQ